MVILAADLGGTQSRLLLARRQSDGWQALRQSTLRSQDFSSFAELLAAFLRPGEQPDSACIAAAGPLSNGRLQLTNLPWLLDAAAISRQYAIPRVRLLNDFAAQAHALRQLQPQQRCALQAGTPQADGVCALLGAGTGLGMALLAGNPAQPLALPSQGGHADFAPQDQQQIDLLRYLLPTHGRVSLELLLSGQGLSRLYAFLDERPVTAADLPDAQAISLAAAAGDSVAEQTLQLFARLLGGAAGNLALTSLAFGGVYLSGGIAPKMLPYLQQAEVREAFCNRPPMRALLERIPLYVVLDEYLGLQGAAQVAAGLDRDSQP
ncbi:glucokinase [Pseudomonas sp. N040]|uniref:glucokinase n=1 Tax=Pseudomonas sp. N040 TaxID=2785325 RepID=UPI0018A25BF9|nr:glucokinase [Pseudomonas sp. N040]MBF7730612.1 glucokinase [Pseudomonas sp. N040]MBW7014255.1 glucokinase [Pseudomonas sp. N040]